MDHDESWAERLAGAIIVTAANDYRLLARKILSGRSQPKHVDELERIHDFFHSEYFKRLTKLDGVVLEKRIAKEAMDEFD